MSPKEKSKELANKYFQESDLLYEDLTWTQAKECALIAVDAVINSNPHSNPFNTEPFSTMDYWIEVKNEIEKL